MKGMEVMEGNLFFPPNEQIKVLFPQNEPNASPFSTK